MKLTRVTLTGADNGVHPQALAELVKQYPWLELGFLFSRNRIGAARYPDTVWWAGASAFLEGVPRAIHLCGDASREALSGFPTRLPSFLLGRAPAGSRVQLNGFSSWRLPMLALAEALPQFEFILQCNAPNAMTEAARLSASHKNVSALFDASGGAGRYQPDLWPVPIGSLRCGYAGGINEFNVGEAISGLAAFPGQHEFWIDVESGCRNANDEFDLAKAQRILELAAPFLESA